MVDDVKIHAACLFDQPEIAEPYAISSPPRDPFVREEARGKRLSLKQKLDELHSNSGSCWDGKSLTPDGLSVKAREEQRVKRG